MIASRTKEALARKKSEGKRLGRPKSGLSKQVKLIGKDEIIKDFCVSEHRLWCSPEYWE